MSDKKVTTRKIETVTKWEEINDLLNGKKDLNEKLPPKKLK